jgi:3-(3-hydroxy-phenyl)propionate hydroxylase
MSEKTVIVVGAGPVGSVAALAAAQAGYRVELIEADQEISRDPRAATFHPSTIEMLDRVGIVDEVIDVGLVARYFDYWDKPARTLVARMDHQILADETKFPYVVQAEQHKVANIATAHLQAMPNVTVRLGTTATALTQDDFDVTLRVEGPGGTETLRADWMIGADGGRSFTRKSLGIEFEGYTWPERFLVLTSLHNFETLGYSYRSYLAAPGSWTNLFKVAGDDLKGRWRAVFPVPEAESDEQAVSDESVAERLGALLDGADPQVVHRNLYRVHQRVAAQFRQRRVFLAGDAAHVNNPIGGLGLNCGIHDAMELVETLSGYDRADGGEDLLDRYERRRRQLNIEFVQQQTIDNKKRLEETDETVRRTKLDELAEIAADPERMRQFLRRTSLLASVEQAKQIA